MPKKQSKLDKLNEELRECNRFLRKIGETPVTMEQFLNRKRGIIEQPKKEFIEYKPKPNPLYVRTTHQYPSAISNTHDCSRPADKRYTGTLIKGIAVTHKSNLVPIMSQQEAEDISRMSS